jgi:hypothetical protein
VDNSFYTPPIEAANRQRWRRELLLELLADTAMALWTAARTDGELPTAVADKAIEAMREAKRHLRLKQRAAVNPLSPDWAQLEADILEGIADGEAAR